MEETVSMTLQEQDRLMAGKINRLLREAQEMLEEQMMARNEWLATQGLKLGTMTSLELAPMTPEKLASNSATMVATFETLHL